MYASLTTVRGGGPRIAETARMAADSMLSWLREFDGYKGLLVFADSDAGTAGFMTFWESREAAERSARSRTEVRQRLIETAGVELQSVDFFELVLEDRG